MTRRSSGAGGAIGSPREEAADLLKIILQCRKRRLSPRKIPCLQILRQCAESLRDRIGLLGRGGGFRAFRVVMVMMMMSFDLWTGVLLQIMLKVCEVLLRSLQIA